MTKALTIILGIAVISGWAYWIWETKNIKKLEREIKAFLDRTKL